MEAVEAGVAVEHCYAMTGTLLALEHGQRERGLASEVRTRPRSSGRRSDQDEDCAAAIVRRISGLREK